VAVAVAVAVAEGSDVAAGETLSARVADIGGSSSSGELCFCGDGVVRGFALLLGGAGFGGLDEVADAVGDLRGDAADFDLSAGVGFGVGVCALWSALR
jgi:hypothetical protein